ncbi:type II toxin-antitoxin system RelE/ParE family toxin [Alteromonas hispanica]|uniref:type II toxin-antitoxin system RelE/ParE family toxin n=1 Tax=Alteromonas hispanica TaxID=315421 RepID=UPI003B834DFD
MHKSKYKLSQLAQTHLHKIKDYTVKNFSDRQWNAYKDTPLTGFHMLAKTPSVGRSCNDLYKNGFYFPTGKHTAYFTKEGALFLSLQSLGNRNYHKIIYDNYHTLSL